MANRVGYSRATPLAISGGQGSKIGASPASGGTIWACGWASTSSGMAGRRLEFYEAEAEREAFAVPPEASWLVRLRRRHVVKSDVECWSRECLQTRNAA